MRNAGLDELQAGIKISARNINILRYVDDTMLNGRKQRGTKKPLDEHEGESERAGLKRNTKKNKIMAHSLIYFIVNRGGKGRSSDRFPFLGSKITADGDCSHEIIRRLLLTGKL